MTLKHLLYINIIVFTTMAVTGSCTSKETEPPANSVFYYPEKNVYFSEENNYYYYSLDGGNSWDSLKNTSSSPAVLGTGIPVDPGTGSIWTNNQQHLREFKGTLLNTINENTIQLARQDSASRVKRVVKSAPAPEPVVEADKEVPKKGIKKFFNKLFGKKKKTEDKSSE